MVICCNCKGNIKCVKTISDEDVCLDCSRGYRVCDFCKKFDKKSDFYYSTFTWYMAGYRHRCCKKCITENPLSECYYCKHDDFNVYHCNDCEKDICIVCRDNSKHIQLHSLRCSQEKQCHLLQQLLIALAYIPGGSVAQEAKSHFNALVGSTTKDDKGVKDGKKEE